MWEARCKVVAADSTVAIAVAPAVVAESIAVVVPVEVAESTAVVASSSLGSVALDRW